MRKNNRLMMFTTSLLALGVAVGCAQQNGDIDRATQEQFQKKADFDGSWYYASTVIKNAPNSPAFEGDGDFIVTERLTWEVTEDTLIGWRDYSAAPGTEDDALDGGDSQFKGQPVAIFSINDHFDIRRTYDSITGEESNVIEKNRERPWYEREYMHVNWADNMAPNFNFRLNPEVYGIASTSHVVEENDVADPKRFRFYMDDGYFETTSRVQMEPDLYAILAIYGPEHGYEFSATIIDVRHSFMKVPNSDYIPLNMPDSVALVDEDGVEMRDENGVTRQIPVMDRFGYFTTWHRKVWDPARGFVYAGEQNYALRHNIWENHRDADGNVLPLAEREAKPVTYYTNVRHPKQLQPAAQRVGAEWNDVFKDMLLKAQPNKYSSLDEVPDMFIVKENDCNPENAQSFFDDLDAVTQTQITLAASQKDTNDERNYLNKDGNAYAPFDGTIAHIAARVEWANSYDNAAPFGARQDLETQALSDLERVCTAMEYYTDPAVVDPTGASEVEITRFEFQRNGDLRYNMINGIVEKALAPWLGVATLLGDPETGEMVHAVANIGLSAIDRSAHVANEAVRALNGEITLDDIFHGYDVQAYVNSKLAQNRKLATQHPGNAARERMSDRIERMRGGQEGLREISPDHNRARLSRLAGTHIEDLVTTDYDMMAYGNVTPDEIEAMDGNIDEAIMDKVSGLRGRTDRYDLDQMVAHFDEMAKLGVDTNAFLDDFAFGAAVEYRDLTPRERFEKIREDLYVSTQLHEVGHTVGLRHNFEASTDALNYHPEFWEIERLDSSLNTALNDVFGDQEKTDKIAHCIDEQTRMRTELNDPSITMTTQQCLGQNQYMFSTIMEYNGHWSADFGGLGKYDYQAIKFGYAQMLETFGAPTTDRTEKETEKALFYNDWRDIPTDIVNGYENIANRDYVQWDWNHSTTMHEPPVNTVPYRFCTDTYMTPTCNRWDFGPDTQTNAQQLQYQYYQRYFFTHFNRDRYWDFASGIWGGGSWFGGVSRDWRTLGDYTSKMRWFTYYSVNDPDFEGTYAYNDFLTTTLQGLNHFSNVISHSRSGRYVTVPNYMTSWGTNSDPETEDRLAEGDIVAKWDYLSSCTQDIVTDISQETNELGITVISPNAAKNGYTLGNVKLGDGRPFAIGSLRTESEEWVINYVGTYYTKDYAIYALADPQAWFPATDYVDNPRNFNISWYSLFPEHVGQIVNNLVTENFTDLGPVMDAAGNTYLRDIIDIDTGDVKQYDSAEYKRIRPTIAFNNQYFAAVYALGLMSTNWDGEHNMFNGFTIATEGAGDDLSVFDTLPAEQVVTFQHPRTGMKVRAVDAGTTPVAANLVRRANILKKRYEVLNECVEGTRDPLTTDYCKCAAPYRGMQNGNQVGLFCQPDFVMLDVGDEGCGEYELENRRDQALEVMEDMVDFMDDVRLIRNVYSN